MARRISLRMRPGPGLGRPGPNPLFFGVLVAVGLGGAAAAVASDKTTVVHSNLVFRLIVGGIMAAVAYGVVAALWFAWHRRTFAKLGSLALYAVKIRSSFSLQAASPWRLA
jgi:predicted ABC-type sugar transport system permease subunit